MLDHARACLERSIQVKQDFMEDGLENVVAAAETIADAMADGKKLLIFGNGGSAADAQHMAAEFTNRFMLERPPLARPSP
jgi:D-sedoheptulose 7-phosphate isomerase